MSHHHHHDKKDTKHDAPAPAGDEAAGTPSGAESPGGEAAGGAAGATTPAAELSLADQLQATRAERDDLLGRLQRVSADYMNYQKRVQREMSQARELANDDILKALLPTLDDMERALDVARKNHAPDDPLLTGMQIVHDKALETLARFGLTPIEAQGKPFDPKLHSALMQQPSAEVPPHTVLKELQRGYELKGRTLRPAHVIVSKEPE